MSVKSLSITEWGNTMVIEPMAHGWKPLHLQYYDLGVGGDFSGKNHKWRTVRLLTQQTRSSAHLCVKKRTGFSGLC